MSDNGRISLLFLANLVLYFIAGELNYVLGAWSVQVHVDALLVIFFGLYLSRLPGLLYTVLLGFLADAMHPAPAGTYVVGYLCLWLFFVWCQRRIRRQNPAHVRSVAALAQVLWMLLLTLVMRGGFPGEWHHWQRVLVETILSSLLVTLSAWPWCSLQRSLLYSLGWDIEAQPQRR